MNKYLKVAIILLCLSMALSLVAEPVSASPGKKGYIVVYHPEVDPDVAAVWLAEAYGIRIGSSYQHALKGSFAILSAQELALVQQDALVLFVEENQVWSIEEAQTIPTVIGRVFADTNPNLSINGTHDYTVDADVAVIDTGIDWDHPDLNVVAVINCNISGPNEGTCDGVKDDGNGHGTHVAGIIGALDNDFGVVGVAPGVRLWAVKVLTNQGIGSTAQIIAGIDWVAGHAEDIEVANMSLGGIGESLVMDLAIDNAVALGVTFTLSAGNRSIDVNNYHPGGNPNAITVSALADFDGLPGGLAAPTCYTDIDDTLANFSNYGTGVDITAPGVCIYSCYKDGSYRTLSGTSMSAPTVAGAAALVAAANPGITPAEIKLALTGSGNYDWVDDKVEIDGIQEPLLDVSDTAIFAPVMLSTDYPITLTAVGLKVAGYQVTEVYWSDATADYVDIYRDGSFLVNTEDDGYYYDEVGVNGEGIHTYRVCETGSTTVCSGTVLVVY